LYGCRRDLHDEFLAKVVRYVSESVDRERGRFVLHLVFEKELVRRLLDRLPALFAGFLFDDLAVALLQALPAAVRASEKRRAAWWRPP
jgi:hypothetical protein